MAVDTRAKRQSAHRAANGWGWIMPHPDSAVAAADRAHVEGYYGGLFDAGAVILVVASRDIMGATGKVNIMGAT